MKHINTFFKSRRFLAGLICALLCVSMLLPLSGCGETRMAQSEISAMDTVMTLTAYGKNREAGLTAAENVIYSMDAMLDPELSTSTTYAINHANGGNTVVSGQVAEMLSTASVIYDQSGGALDLSIYPLVKRWGFVDGKYYVPTDEEISQEMAKLCYGDMVLSSFPSSGSYAVRFPAGAEISFASIGKGCTAENAANAMRQAGVESGMITMSGNVQTLGLKPDGSNWTVAIEDPNNTASYLGIVSVGEAAVVTSGGYMKSFTDMRGRSYHHILNPSTGYPVNNSLLSATVICDDGAMADALATCMYVLGESKALTYWRTYGGFDMVLVTSDLRVVCTSGLIEQITLTNDAYTLSFSE